MKALYTPLLIMSLGLAACASQAPHNKGIWPFSANSTIQSADQWNAIAADVAQRLQAALASSTTTQKPLVLHVERPRSGIFNEAFHQLLITQLLAHGFGVSSDPASGVPVRYSTQLITHNQFVAPNLLVDPSREIIINVSVKSGDRYATRISEIYTVSEYNYSLFLAQVDTPTSMEVVGP